MGSRDLDEAVAEMVRVLTPHARADWRRQAGELDWSCWETAAHVAHDLLAYAGQLAALPDSAYLPFDLVVSDDASPHDLLRVAAGAGRLLSVALAASDPSVRAWHWGPTDPSGFAALGVNETLVHTPGTSPKGSASTGSRRKLSAVPYSPGSFPARQRGIRSRRCSGPPAVLTFLAVLDPPPGSRRPTPDSNLPDSAVHAAYQHPHTVHVLAAVGNVSVAASGTAHPHRVCRPLLAPSISGLP